MKHRTIALLLAAALGLSLIGGAALAVEDDAASSGSTAAQTDGAPTSGEPDVSPENTEGAEEMESAVYGADAGEVEEEQEEQPPAEEYIPDPVGSISFTNLEHRLRENNLNLLALEESIQAIEAIDYEKMTDDIRKQINQIAQAQWGMITGIPGGIGSIAASSMDAAYDSLRDTFDDLKDGKIQEDNAAVIRQLENAQEQIIMAAESLYVALVDLELNDSALDRQLTALDRTIQEMELRYELGHISSQTLRQTQASRTALVSGQQTLEMNISNYKAQLEMLIGAEQTGNIQLQGLPQVTSQQLEEMDLEADLAAAKEVSYNLFAAQRTLEDAQEDFKDAGKDYNYNEKKYQYVSAQHTWESAQYTYQATLQSFENSFRSLYLQVKDYKQVLDAARTALAVEQDNYSVAQLKHSQGSLSDNGLLEAEDKVKSAQETVEGAEVDLFTAYNNYRWAVDYGILN
ncbi:TolC family protein [Flintibacter sp. HCN-6482]|uniref:TolC family protein n=1 Tax=Flintibacter sp. HCN-6482 TaxID=3134672 RepID=UPI0030BCBCA5